jgi:hypothetical protein
MQSKSYICPTCWSNHITPEGEITKNHMGLCRNCKENVVSGNAYWCNECSYTMEICKWCGMNIKEVRVGYVGLCNIL